MCPQEPQAVFVTYRMQNYPVQELWSLLTKQQAALKASLNQHYSVVPGLDKSEVWRLDGTIGLHPRQSRKNIKARGKRGTAANMVAFINHIPSRQWNVLNLINSISWHWWHRISGGCTYGDLLLMQTARSMSTGTDHTAHNCYHLKIEYQILYRL